jgi:ATP-binding cassette subfamily B multidrug efflux pump
VEYYETDDDTNGQGSQKLYSREVLKLLSRYVLSYKRHLLSALLLVLLITGSSVAVPWILKVIIDRHIFKQGRVMDLSLYSGTFRKPLHLEGNRYFLFQSQLKQFSQKQKQKLVSGGALSPTVYLLIESPSFDPEIKAKLDSFNGHEEVLRFTEGENPLYLVSTAVIGKFTVNEVFALRMLDLKNIARYTILIALILLGQFAASYIQIILLMRLSQNAMRDLRKDLMDHLLRLDVSYYDRNPIGKLVNRITNDIETLNELFSSVLITLFQDILMMFGIAAVMFFTDLYLAGVVASTFPFIILFTIMFRIKVRNAYRVIRTKITQLNSFLNETITGIRIIQIFVREIRNMMKFKTRNDAVYYAQRRQMYVYAVFRPLISFLRWISIAAVIYFGARGIGLDRVSYGLLVMFIAYVERFFAPVQDLSEKFDIMQSATAAGEKIVSLFRLKRGVQQKEDFPERLRRFEGRIVFEDVWFAYEPGQWILKGVSFTVEPKRTLAIVGETGAGKSTIINLLSRFYTPQRGRIMIDGIDIKELPNETVRSNVAAVMQDVFLFSRTVRENIVLGGEYDASRFKEITRATHTDGFIDSLRRGEQEMVMERGSTFSQGQRQLLSFARALYFDPSVLVLDEATSSIDTETERLIQDAIRHLVVGRTSIIIAHRLSTVKRADSIIVIERGRVVEKGTHGELLEKGGIYHHLYMLQFSTL